ncbi:hypothetical protein HanRHA438_Chr10g0444811 [Helianthus annuus]|nr:hypothetical protein HanRHA438_Chr10g0444811 [Helianthus annuus]
MFKISGPGSSYFWFDSRFWFELDCNGSRYDRSRVGQRWSTQSTAGQTRSTQSTWSTRVNRTDFGSGQTQPTRVLECFSCTLASSHSWNHITESR